MTVPEEEATANYVPAAAVIRRWQALSGFTGCKGVIIHKKDIGTLPMSFFIDSRNLFHCLFYPSIVKVVNFKIVPAFTKLNYV